MLKNLSLKWKISLILGIVVPVLLGIAYYESTHYMALLRQSAKDSTLESARRYANKIDTDMSEAMVAARSIARFFEGVAQTPNVPSRENLIDMLKGMLRDNPQFLGVYVAMEPDSLDGLDSKYNGRQFHELDGGFRPWVHRDKGKITVQQSTSIDDPSAPGATWYYLPKKKGSEILMEPWAYDIAGTMVLMVDTVVPMYRDGSFIGVAGVDFPMDTIDSFVSDITLYKSGYGVLITNKGRYVAHPENPEYVDESANVFKLEESSKALKDGLRHKVFKGSSLTLIEEIDGREMLCVYVPLTIGRTDTPYVFGLRVPMDEVLAEVRASRNVVMVISIVSVVLVALAIMVIARSITKPMRQTVDAVEVISQGDLSVRLPADSTDEIGRMQLSVNNMAAELQRSMAQADEQRSMAEEKSLQAEKARKAAEEALEQAEVARQDGRRLAASQLEAIVSNISTAADEVLAQAEEIRNGADHQRERIATTATAMEQMNATVLEVAQNASETASQAMQDKENAQNGSHVVEQSVQAMDSIQQQALQLKDSMNLLGDKAKEIGSVMNVIEDIADQTNLLALNAAIEAARAGDAGRGFAVVADEVRKLAEKTMGATKEVGDSIGSIQTVAQGNLQRMDETMESITSASSLSNELGEVFSSIAQGVETSAARIQSIATATEEQSATSEEINRSVEEINQIAMDTATSAGEAIGASEEMSKQSGELAKIVDELKSEAG